MTDNEIIKALEGAYKIEPTTMFFITDYKTNKITTIGIGDIVDLINRQKAENEELVGNIDKLKEENGNLIVEFQSMRNAENGFKNELFDKTELLKTAMAEIERLQEIIEYKDICIEAVKTPNPKKSNSVLQR